MHSPASSARLPLCISVPHSGTLIPQDIADRLKGSLLAAPPDTDWHVHDVYQFMVEQGATLIHTPYSRYVIDLNRDFKGAALYKDGRQESGLVPLKAFSGEALYEGGVPTPGEIEERLKTYYWPYYHTIQEILDDLKRRFGQVIFLDGHSIARLVPTIRKEPFPDLILGNNDGKSASAAVVSAAWEALRESSYQVSHNDPFKGGHLTRYFGRPEEGVHALQIEMSQDIYLEANAGPLPRLSAKKLAVLQGALRNVFRGVLEAREQKKP